MKKKDAAEQFLQTNAFLFQCPVCQSAFEGMESGSFVCTEGHAFDLSKKGTLHFLLKQSKSEYGKEMLASRHSIAEAGLFDPILEKIYMNIDQKEGVILDVGCGEGSHLNKLAEMGLNGRKIGFDISKEGIQLAASHYRSAFWCVADLSHPPFAFQQYDTILNIFSPSNYKEFKRLLAEKGQVLKVVPEEHYLIELRQHFYKGQEEKEVYSNKEVVDHFSDQFPEVETQRITYSFPVPSDKLKALISMTPLSWSAGEEEIAHLLNKGLEEVTVDVLLLIGRL